jgi:hypothetical protein
MECLRLRCTMEWVKERDLLIAQTLAFVQSVANERLNAGKPQVRKLEAGKLDARRFDVEPVARPRVEAAPIDAIKFVEPPARLPFSMPAPRVSVSGDVRAEIQNRVATFRAHQERFRRERDEYCSATLAKVGVAVGNGSAPPAPRK